MANSDIDILARQIVGLEKKHANLARATQLQNSSVRLVDGSEIALSGSIQDTQDVASDVTVLNETTEDLGILSDNEAVNSTEVTPWIYETGQGSDLVWESSQLATDMAMEASANVDAALVAANQAAEDALLAKETADGKNRIFAQMVKPVAHPDIPFIAGDLWYETDSTGRFVNVWVWNQTTADFVQHRLVASSVLVPGSVGPVLIEDGGITSPKLAADALNFKTATGMSLSAATITSPLVRTAPSGMRIEFNTNGIQSFGGLGEHLSSILPDSDGFSIRGGLRISQAKLGETETWYSKLDENGLALLTDIPIGGGINAHSEGSLRAGDLSLKRPYRSPGGVGKDGGQLYATAGSGAQQTTMVVMDAQGAAGQSSGTIRLDPPPATPTTFNQNGNLTVQADYPADIRIRSALAPATPAADKGRFIVDAQAEFLQSVKFQGDTGWVNLSSYINSAYRQECWGRRKLGLIEILFSSGSKAVPVGNTTLGNLPVAWRPGFGPNRRAAAYMDGGYPGVFFISLDGNIGVSHQAPGARAAYGHIIYGAD